MSGRTRGDRTLRGRHRSSQGGRKTQGRNPPKSAASFGWWHYGHWHGGQSVSDEATQYASKLSRGGWPKTTYRCLVPPTGGRTVRLTSPVL
jgi:hypothetical protein